MVNNSISFLVMDVDGVLTDGHIYVGSSGELFKAFNVKDGYGIKNILPRIGITPLIITARESEALQFRCKELGIEHLYQSATNKLDVLNEFLQKISEEKKHTYSLSDVAYIGDDIPDMGCIQAIREGGGIVGCPSDAVSQIQKCANFISSQNGGAGAVRSFIEYLAQHNGRLELGHRISMALQTLKRVAKEPLSLGRHEINAEFYFNVDSYTTGDAQNRRFESHKKYVDIQYIIEGQEEIDITDCKELTILQEYDSVEDVVFWRTPDRYLPCVLSEGSYVVLYPNHAHRPGVYVNKAAEIKKIVGKVLVPEEVQ